jgi:hypothetical protein
MGNPVILSARLPLNHQTQLVYFKEIPRCYLTFKHMDFWSNESLAYSQNAQGTGWDNAFS